jgi:type I restriction enzyme M protein
LEINVISRIFDNTDFGCTRVAVERPLRLRYQLDTDRKTDFIDTCLRLRSQIDTKRTPLFPDTGTQLFDDMEAIEQELGQEPHLDWNEVWLRVQGVLGKRKSKWLAPEQKLFRDIFTKINPTAAPVILERGITGEEKHLGQTSNGKIPQSEIGRLCGLFLDPSGKTKDLLQYEPDTRLRDFENIPLKEDIAEYFIREVLPHVPDAWMDRTKDKVGYEINFNRHFYRYQPPRPLEAIDADLKRAEEEIVRLLREVTA